MTVPTEFLMALTAQQSVIESELTERLAPAAAEMAKRWRPYEREKAFEQTVNLGEGRDCNYDRPTVGVAYATWYMPRRIQDATRLLAPLVLEWKAKELCIADLGCGTGATWWACRAIVNAMRTVGRKPPLIRIIGCDISLQMLRLADDVWSALTPASRKGVEVEARLSSWTHLSGLPQGSVIVASYLMDQSDKYRVEEVGEAMRRLADKIRSENILIVGASNKRAITNQGLAEIVANDPAWSVSTEVSVRQVWAGEIPALARIRQVFASGCTGVTSRLSQRAIPTWTPDGADFRFLKRSAFNTLLHDDDQMSLVLDERQDKAATPDERMTAILGSAGSGKSRVLAERLARTVHLDLSKKKEERKYLVTCFNKEVRWQLQKWFLDRMTRDPKFGNQVHHLSGSEYVIVAGLIRIEFVTWDAVITRQFELRGNPSAESETVMKQIIDKWAKKEPRNESWLAENPWITPKFVMQEIKRVVYGLGALTEDKYVSVTRTGRPPLPKRGPDVRRNLWRLLDSNNREEMWVDRRIKALAKVDRGSRPKAYDRVFLDECQDFTQADFKILESLTKEVKALVVCGDGTQAMNTGSGYFRPPSVGGARWEIHTLEGSYRLPIRICEAIEPIAQAIQSLRHHQRGESQVAEEDLDDIMLPRSVKSAVLGVRPILISANSEQQLSQHLYEVMLHYRDFVILERDRPSVVNADNIDTQLKTIVATMACHEGLDYRVENSSMLKIKGLERPFILWSTKFDSSSVPGSATYEWIYTILTRSTRVLVIILNTFTPKDIQALLGRMRRECLLFWDELAEEHFDNFAKHVNTASDPFAVITGL